MEQHVIQLAKLLLDGQDRKAKDLIQQYRNEESILSIYEKLVTPAMYYIGELWENNEISVADEHLATAVCDMILTELSQEKTKNATIDKKVMLLGLEEEQHYIGLRMVATVFKHEGWDVRYLGPNLPLNHMLSFIRKWEPEVVGISIALPYRLPKLIEYIEAIVQLEDGPEMVIGGRMANKVLSLDAAKSDKVHVVMSLRQLQDWIVTGNIKYSEEGEKDYNATT